MTMASGNETSSNCRLDVNNFVDNLLDQEVHFLVLKMKDSFFVWIGSETARLEGLAVAMTTKTDNDPSSASLFGENVDILSTSIAKKLAKATKKQVFVSYNLPSNQQLISLVEKRVNDEMKTHPEWF